MNCDRELSVPTKCDENCSRVIVSGDSLTYNFWTKLRAVNHSFTSVRMAVLLKLFQRSGKSSEMCRENVRRFYVRKEQSRKCVLSLNITKTMGDICDKEVYNLFMLMYNLLYINTEVLTVVLFIICNCYKGAKAIGIGTRDFRSILRLTPKLSRETIGRVAYEDFFGWSSDILVENVA